MKPGISIVLVAGIVAGALVLQACGDDPILSPQAGKKAGGGSYGNIAIAPQYDTSAAPRSSVSREQRSSERTQKPARISRNPELY